MITVLAANDFGDNLGDGVAGPIGLLIIILLVIATVFLMRSMNRHLKRVPDKFPDQDPSAPSRQGVRPDRQRADRADDGSRRPSTQANQSTTGNTGAND